MQRHTVALREIPPQGQTVTVADPAVWQAPIAEFGMDCRITVPLEAALTLLPVEGGCLVRGQLKGEAVVPCDRCAEDTVVPIAHTIETFAPLPSDGPALDPETQEAEAQSAEEAHVRWENSAPMLDIASLCWEEFMLALPLRPLCTPKCKGLCAQCGTNLNHGQCQCGHAADDPRLAALRNLTIQKKAENTSDT